MSSGSNKLSKCELKVLKLAAEGLCGKRTARALECAEGTVRLHRKNVIKKLGARNITHAVTLALAGKLIFLEQLRIYTIKPTCMPELQHLSLESPHG